MRYFIYFSFKGTNYHGSQKQPNGVSVQEVLQHTCTTLLRAEVPLTFASRTDAGVHAKMMVAHFDYTDKCLDGIVEKLNRFLPQDIVVQKIIPVPPTLHARYDAISRTYEYHITTQRNPFTTDTSVYIPYPLNISVMNSCATILLGEHDFASFAKIHSDVKTTICTITYTQWEQCGTELIFTITANRFLRNMVRAIVGTMLLVGRGKITPTDFQAIIDSKSRTKAGMSAPPQGLFLTDIKYNLC